MVSSNEYIVQVWVKATLPAPRELVAAVDQHAGQCTQRIGVRQTAGPKAGKRLRQQLPRVFFGRFEAQQRYEGRFVLRGVLTGSLAQRCRIGRYIQNVVDDLECQSHRGAVIVQRVLGRRRSGAAGRRGC